MLNQINKFNYLRYDVSYEGEKNLNIKIKYCPNAGDYKSVFQAIIHVLGIQELRFI
jgi:hypothetical protein